MAKRRSKVGGKLIPHVYLYTKDHAWILVQNDGTVRVGVTEFPLRELGDIKNVELPQGGEEITRNVIIGAIEGERGVFDLVAPLSGTVVAVNSHLLTDPSSLGYMAFQEFLFDLAPSKWDEESKDLISAAEYETLI